MNYIELDAELRTQAGKGYSHRLRREGKIPAILYGKTSQAGPKAPPLWANLKLSVGLRELEKAVSTQAGMNAVIRLNVKGEGVFDVLLKDYQADAIKRHFIHADFLKVDLTKKIQIAVPVHLTGRPEGVKEGGILEQVTRQLQIFCLPLKIPQQIDVDVGSLKIGQNLHLSDVKLPEGVESAETENVTIAIVAAPKEEEELTPGVMTEPEVLTAKKEEGEEGATAPSGSAPAGLRRAEAASAAQAGGKAAASGAPAGKGKEAAHQAGPKGAPSGSAPATKAPAAKTPGAKEEKKK